MTKFYDSNKAFFNFLYLLANISIFSIMLILCHIIKRIDGYIEYIFFGQMDSF